MPTLLNEDGFRFSFYTADRAEPPHVHVTRERKELKIWLQTLKMARNKGFSAVEARKIKRIVERHQDQFLETWHEYFRDN